MQILAANGKRQLGPTDRDDPGPRNGGAGALSQGRDGIIERYKSKEEESIVDR
jgi:hypothetical protein